MIPVGQVTTALLAMLRTAEPTIPIGDGVAPADTSKRYGIVELVAGGAADGSMGDPESDAWVRFRVRGVGLDSVEPYTGEVGGREARWVADRLRAVLMDRTRPIAGTGWRVTGRTHDAYGGSMVEGRTTNVVDDYLLFVASA